MSEKRYDSNADRQRAYRERKRLEQVIQGEDLSLGVPAPPSESLDEIEERTPSITLEQYVELIREEALAYSKAIGETNEPWQIPGTKEFILNRRKDRMKRAEVYARWRYEGFLTGEVASL